MDRNISRLMGQWDKTHTVESLPGEDTVQSHWKEVSAQVQILQDAP